MALSDALQGRLRPQKDHDEEMDIYDQSSDSPNAESGGSIDSVGEDTAENSADSQDEFIVCSLFACLALATLTVVPVRYVHEIE